MHTSSPEQSTLPARVERADFRALSIPDSVSVPESIDDARQLLDGVGGLLSAGHWGTAAIVWAYTEDAQGERRDLNLGEKSPKLSLTDFAALGIRGLSTRNSVRKYRRAWQDAIEEGLAEPANPGARVTLPAEPFKTENGAHVGQNSGENEWYSPADFVEAARIVMGGIDLDPASHPDANEVVKAECFFAEEDDGLAQEWFGRVWMNPPYAQPLIGQFAEKLAASIEAASVSQACILVNNGTETKWFQRMMDVASVICLPSGRIRFWHPDRNGCAPLQGQAVLYCGPDRKKFRETFARFGSLAVVTPLKTATAAEFA